MMRSLYTAASGMRAQQTNLDVISNNLANVNSTGYKTSTAEFKSLLYQTLQTRSTSANGSERVHVMLLLPRDLHRVPCSKRPMILDSE